MAFVVSTRCTYASHEGLPELTGGARVEIPDEMLPVALRFLGVVQVDAPVSEEAVADESPLEQVHPSETPAE